MKNRLIIALSNETKKQIKNYQLFEEVMASHDDPCIKQHLEDAIKEFGEVVEKIKMKIDIEVL